MEDNVFIASSQTSGAFVAQPQGTDDQASAFFSVNIQSVEEITSE